MDLTRECLDKAQQGKRMGAETTYCKDSIKKMKTSSNMMCTNIADSKENRNSEMPLDMSLGSKSYAMDCVQQNGKSLDSSVRFLRDQLRNEETTLLLLKKILQNQLLHAVRSGRSLVGTNSQNHDLSNSITATCASNAVGRVMAARPQYTNHIGSQSSSTMSQSMLHITAHQQEPSLPVQAHNHLPVNGVTSVKESSVRPAVSRPPPVVNQQTHEQTLAQRQALAKLAIRRQLETTLLQLPMPKCTPQELSFIPTVGFYADFIALIGMEEAVKWIINGEGTTNRAVEMEKSKPLQCSQCETDCTPLWKPEGYDTNVCEQCVIKSRKQAFRQEHTARLKAAFYEALQQEQQIEGAGILKCSGSTER